MIEPHVAMWLNVCLRREILNVGFKLLAQLVCDTEIVSLLTHWTIDELTDSE